MDLRDTDHLHTMDKPQGVWLASNLQDRDNLSTEDKNPAVPQFVRYTEVLL